MNSQWTRRDIVITGAAAAVVAGCGIPIAVATAKGSTELTPTERSNVELLKQFLASFNKPGFDIDKITAKYLAPNCSMRWADTEAPAIGPEAAAAAAKKMGMSGMTVDIKILKLLALGPLVATSRIDTAKVAGKPDAAFKVAGVAIIKGGKIQEYCDYVVADGQ
jgi:limonene-1,2-epoxide hydrolase